MTTRPRQGRALFYTRDSGGKHENTPGQYVAWAQRQASLLGLSFDGTPESIEDMIRSGQCRRGDLFLDYGVSGNTLIRDGLNALIREAETDPVVSHILIPRRDRLARPDDPIDAVNLEAALRKKGITLVFMDRVCPPLRKGQRGDIGDLIVSLMDYEKSGKDRRELAEKMVWPSCSWPGAASRWAADRRTASAAGWPAMTGWRCGSWPSTSASACRGTTSSGCPARRRSWRSSAASCSCCRRCRPRASPPC
jgi:hypothetical protein